MRWRWRSCSAASEDRVVAGGESLGTALLIGPGRDAKHRLGRWQTSLRTRTSSIAEPLDSDDEHEVIRRINQESDESLMVEAEM